MVARYRSPVDAETLEEQARQDRDYFNEHIDEAARRLRRKIVIFDATVTLVNDVKEGCQELLGLLAARSSIEFEESVDTMPESSLR